MVGFFFTCRAMHFETTFITYADNMTIKNIFIDYLLYID